VVPMTTEVRLQFWAYDDAPDHIVEMGLDNVRIEGDRQVCDPLGVANSPNGVGDSVRLAKVSGDAEISWQASTIDPTHDGAAYYKVFVSGAPDGGFAVDDTATEVRSTRSLAGMPREYYMVTAVNSAGTSGDEPAP